MSPTRASAVAVLVATTVVTIEAGTPARLPDVALSSAVLFHVERTVALLAGSVAVLLIASRAWRGELPLEIGSQGLKYSDAGLDGLKEEALRAREERGKLARRIEALEGEAYRAKGG